MAINYNVKKIISYLQQSESKPENELTFFCEYFCEELYLITRHALQESFKDRMIYILKTTNSLNLRKRITIILSSIRNIDNYLKGENYNRDGIINIGNYSQLITEISY